MSGVEFCLFQMLLWTLNFSCRLSCQAQCFGLSVGLVSGINAFVQLCSSVHGP